MSDTSGIQCGALCVGPSFIDNRILPIYKALGAWVIWVLLHSIKYMRKAIFYVGADNTTKRLNREKIESIVASFFDGFSASEIVGYWKGTKENTLKVEVVTESEDSTIHTVAQALRDGLNQESVMVEIESNQYLFV